MGDFLWTAATFLYVFLSLLLAFFVWKKTGSGEWPRKIVHFLVSFTIFPIVCFVGTLWLKLLGPIVFVLINAFLPSLFPGFLDGGGGKRRLGLLLYPLSFLALVVLESLSVIRPSSALAAALVLGSSDAAAAAFGSLPFASVVRFRNGKSLMGTLAFFLVSVPIFFFVGSLSLPFSFVASAAAAAVELFVPGSWDNAATPAAAAVLAETLCRIL